MTESQTSSLQMEVLEALSQVIESRKGADAESSYVASLFSKGLDSVTEKITEEAQETVQAANERNRDQVIYETADLWFHSMVLLAVFDLTFKDILKELERRFGISGLEEKMLRTR